MLNSDLKNARIQIVDDQQVNIDLLEQFLRSQGFSDIATTTNPHLAVSLFQSFNPDIVLIDLMMPELSGFEVLEQMSQLIKKDVFCPILVLTADITTSSKQRSLARGARDFITKPFDLVELLFRIMNLLETRSLYLKLEEKIQNLEERVEMFIELLRIQNK